MKNPDDNPTVPAGQTDLSPALMRYVRLLWRLPLLLVHAAIVLPPTLAVVAYGYHREGAARFRAERAMGWWSACLLKIFGFRIAVEGTPHSHPAVLLANHVSWADIELIHSQLAAGFVAKAEIARWPVIGFMARVGGSVFHQRGQRSSQERVTQALAQRLQNGRSIAIFPEGKTGSGIPVLPFHGRLLQAAVETGTPIQAVAVEYLRDNRFAADVPFQPGESFGASLVRMLGQPETLAKIHFLDSRLPDDGRRELARWAQQQVARVVERHDPV